MNVKISENVSRTRLLQKALGFKFRNSKRMLEALTHTSAPNFPTEGPSSYERLEFFGDTILNFVICEKLYRLFPDANEGMLSRMRSTLVSKKLLARIAQKLGIGRFMIAGNSQQEQELRHPKMLADTLEALIGALYLDRGLNAPQEFIWKHWAPYFDKRKIARFDPNPKSTLQEMVQKMFKALPHYETLSAPKGFSASVTAGHKFRGRGKGLSKKEAEEKAALDLLKKLKQKHGAASKKGKD